MQGQMNAIAQTSARTLSGSKLDNRRMLAALIDLAVVGAGGAAILVAAGVLGGDGGSLSAPLAGMVLCWALYYYFACESGGGQTIGKKLTRVRVVGVDGRAAGMREIALRTVLRVIDTALVGLIAMLATGERRARLGDLAAATMIVSTDGAAAPAPSVAPAVAATETPDVAATETPAAIEAPEVEDEPDPYGEELAEVVEGEPVVGYEPITRLDPVEDTEPVVVDTEPVVVEAEPVVVEAEPVVEPEPVADDPVSGEQPAKPWLVKEAGPELSVVEALPRMELVSDVPAADRPPIEEHTLDVATPSLKELAEDVAAATGSEAAAEAEPVAEAGPVVEVVPVAEAEPVVEPALKPLAEVEIGGPEIDVDEPELTVRSVDTVSAIDLVMGADEPSEDRPAADDPPAGA
jgi:uncharacterized RDD family membrane protein YckC